MAGLDSTVRLCHSRISLQCTAVRGRNTTAPIIAARPPAPATAPTRPIGRPARTNQPNSEFGAARLASRTSPATITPAGVTRGDLDVATRAVTETHPSTEAGTLLPEPWSLAVPRGW